MHALGDLRRCSNALCTDLVREIWNRPLIELTIGQADRDVPIPQQEL
jgi:hypothetical protein